MTPRRFRVARRSIGFLTTVAYFITNVFVVPGMAGTNSVDFWRGRAAQQKNLAFTDLRLNSDPNGNSLSLPFASRSFPIFDSLLKRLSLTMRVQSVRVGAKNAPTVFLIQDIHRNNEAQKNIAQALSVIDSQLSQAGPILVAAEAAHGPLNFQPYRAAPTISTRKAIADYLLREKYISAVAWFGLWPDASSKIVGVDDDGLYGANVAAVRAAVKHQPGMVAEIQKLSADLSKQRVRALSKKLDELSGALIAYHHGQMPIVQYVRLLGNYADLTHYPMVEKLVRATNIETKIDSVQVKQERDTLFRKVASRKRISDWLAQATYELNAGAIDSNTFHLAFKKLLATEGVDLSSTPHFEKYLEYVALADSIQHEALFKEISDVTKEAIGKAAATPTERKLLERTVQLCLAQKLVNFELTPAEWGEYKKGRSPFLPFEDFYRLAEARSEKMAGNILKSTQRNAVLVAGGFHTPDIARILEARGFSTITLAPIIRDAANIKGSDYLSAFLRERSPLAKLFEGEKLTLADSAQLLAVPSAEAAQNAARILNGVAQAAAKNAKNPVAIISHNGATVEAGPGVRGDENHRFENVLGYKRIGFREKERDFRFSRKSPRSIFLASILSFSIAHFSDGEFAFQFFFVSGFVLLAWTVFEVARFGWGLYRGAELKAPDFYRALREAAEHGLIPESAVPLVRHADGTWFGSYQSGAHVYDSVTKSHVIFVRTEFAYNTKELARIIRHELFHKNHQSQAPPTGFDGKAVRPQTTRVARFDSLIRAVALNPFLDFLYELAAHVVEWTFEPTEEKAVNLETHSLDFNADLNNPEFLHRFHAELLKEIETLGSGKLRKIVVVSDQHGTIDKFDVLLVDAIRQVENRIPDGFVLDPDKTMNEQFAPFGFQLEDLKDRIFFHNLGDLMDRGPYGVKVYWRSKELLEAGISDFVMGNHDLWMLMNLMAYHLPWGPHFDFKAGTDTEYSDKYDDDYGTVREAVEHHNHAWRDGDESLIAWWAERLAEFTNEQRDIQKKKWSALEQKVNGAFEEDGKTRRKGTGLYDKVSASIEANEKHKKLWDQFRGYYLVDIYRGVRAVGEMSLPWWENLLQSFQEAYELEVKSSAEYNPSELRPSDEAWEEAIKMMHSIIKDLTAELDQHMAQNKWWVRAFHALNRGNYTTMEWWAKDWIFHEGWGPSVIKELNEIARKRAPDSLESLIPTTNANYLGNPIMMEVRDWMKQNFNLFVTDEYLTTGMHAFLPVDKAGRFSFRYNGNDYMGKGGIGQRSVWEGLSAISNRVKTGTDLLGMKHAFDVINNIYADNTTKVKPPDVAHAINTIGPRLLSRNNGYNRLSTGHIPFHEFYKLMKDDRLGLIDGFQIDDSVMFSDHGMGKRFDGRGGYIFISPDGVRLRGFEHDGDKEIKWNSRTVKKAGTDEQVLFKNAGIPKSRFLPQLEREYGKRISQISGAGRLGPAMIFYYLTESRWWGTVLLVGFEIPVIVALRYYAGPVVAANVLLFFAALHAPLSESRPALFGARYQGLSFALRVFVFSAYVLAPINTFVGWALLPAALQILVDLLLVFPGAIEKPETKRETEKPAVPEVIVSVVPRSLTTLELETYLTTVLNPDGMRKTERTRAFQEIIDHADKNTLAIVHEKLRQTPSHKALATTYNGHGYTVVTERVENPEVKVLELLLARLREKLSVKIKMPGAPAYTNIDDIPYLSLRRSVSNDNEYLYPVKPIATQLIDKAISSNKIGLTDVADERFRNFLLAIKNHVAAHPDSMLRYVVVMGGAAGKGIFFQDSVNDLDLTVRLELTEAEFRLLQDSHSAGVLNFNKQEKRLLARKIHDHVDRVLTELAQFVGAEKDKLLDPANLVPIRTADGLELQFFGPILGRDTNNLEVLMLRTAAATVTLDGEEKINGMMNFYVTASLLHLAIDAEGRIYPRLLTAAESEKPAVSWDALEKLRKGVIEIVIDAFEWNPGTLLRVAAIELRYALQVESRHWDFNTLIRRSIGDFILRPKPAGAVRKCVTSLKVLLQRAIDGSVVPNAAHTRLREAGIYQFVEKLISPRENRWHLLHEGGIRFGKHEVQSIQVKLPAGESRADAKKMEIEVEVRLGQAVDMRVHAMGPQFDGDVVHLLGMPPEKLVALDVTVLDASGNLENRFTTPVRLTNPTAEHYGGYVFRVPFEFKNAGPHRIEFRVFNPFEPEVFADKVETTLLPDSMGIPVGAEEYIFRVFGLMILPLILFLLVPVFAPGDFRFGSWLGFFVLVGIPAAAFTFSVIGNALAHFPVDGLSAFENFPLRVVRAFHYTALFCEMFIAEGPWVAIVGVIDEHKRYNEKMDATGGIPDSLTNGANGRSLTRRPIHLRSSIRTYGLAEWKNFSPSQLDSEDVIHVSLAEFEHTNELMRKSRAFHALLERIFDHAVASRLVVTYPSAMTIDEAKTRFQELLYEHHLSIPMSVISRNVIFNQRDRANPVSVTQQYKEVFGGRVLHALSLTRSGQYWDFNDVSLNSDLPSLVIEVIDLLRGRSMFLSKETIQEILAHKHANQSA